MQKLLSNIAQYDSKMISLHLFFTVDCFIHSINLVELSKKSSLKVLHKNIIEKVKFPMTEVTQPYLFPFI